MAAVPLQAHAMSGPDGNALAGGRGRVAGPQETAVNEALYRQLESHAMGQKPAEAPPASPEPAAVVTHGDVARQPEGVWADTSKQAAYAPVAGDNLKAVSKVEAAKEGRERILLPSALAAAQPAAQEQSLGRGLTPDQGGAGQLALNSAGAFQFGWAPTPADGRKDQLYFGAAAGRGVANADGDKVAILGDVPTAGKFFRQQPRGLQ